MQSRVPGRLRSAEALPITLIDPHEKIIDEGCMLPAVFRCDLLRQVIQLNLPNLPNKFLAL